MMDSLTRSCKLRLAVTEMGVRLLAGVASGLRGSFGRQEREKYKRYEQTHVFVLTKNFSQCSLVPSQI